MRLSHSSALSLTLALILTSSTSALELSRTLPAADISQPPNEVCFLIYDGPEVMVPLERADFGPGQYLLEEQGDQIAISAEFLQDLDPRGLWIETELDGQIKGERVALRAVTPGITFASGNNLDMDDNTIVNLEMPAAPGDGLDAANRAYVDSADTTGNAATATTATALVTDGSDCPAGQYARGVNESGTAQGCAPAPAVGPDVGDMQYWDRTAWVLIPATGVNARMLSLCSGVPTWTTDGCFNVDDRGPAGGIVFHITDGGMHGLETSLADQSSAAAWGCSGTPIDGADGTEVGTGAQNTLDILTDCATAGIAADIADDYELNGYTDCFFCRQKMS